MRVGYLGDLYKIKNCSLQHLSDFCEDNGLNLLVLCGGISEDYETSLNIISSLGKMLDSKGISLRFIIGNTDLYYHDEVVVDKEKKVRRILKKYLENRYSLITHPIMTYQLVILGCNGWYDYSYYRGKDVKLSSITKKKKYFIQCADVKYLTDVSDYTLGVSNTFDVRYTNENNNSLVKRLQDVQRMYGKPIRSVVVTYFKPHRVFLGESIVDKYFGTFEGNVNYSKILSSMRVNSCYFGMCSSKAYAKVDGVNYYCCGSDNNDFDSMEIEDYD